MERKVISISGTGSVGKSTLLGALREEADLSEYKFVDEVTRKVKAAGYPINEQATDSTQLAIAAAHEENIKYDGKVILDRSLLDCLAYTVYMQEKGQVTLGTLDYIGKKWLEYSTKIDLYFYIPIEFPAEDDGIRSIEVEFRERVDEIIQGLFADLVEAGFENKINILTGTVEERIKKFKEIINKEV